MNPKFDYPNTTETMAELAWRYGMAGTPCRYVRGYWLFYDGSSICWKYHYVNTPRCHRRMVEMTHGMMPIC